MKLNLPVRTEKVDHLVRLGEDVTRGDWSEREKRDFGWCAGGAGYLPFYSRGARNNDGAQTVWFIVINKDNLVMVLFFTQKRFLHA